MRRYLVIIALVSALLLPACAASRRELTSTGGDKRQPASASAEATEAIAGFWRAVGVPRVIGLDFSRDGEIRQTLQEPRSGRFSEQYGTWKMESDNRILCHQPRIGFPDAWAIYEYRVHGDRLTLTWVNTRAPVPQTGRAGWVPWLGGTQHLKIVLAR